MTLQGNDYFNQPTLADFKPKWLTRTMPPKEGAVMELHHEQPNTDYINPTQRNEQSRIAASKGERYTGGRASRRAYIFTYANGNRSTTDIYHNEDGQDLQKATADATRDCAEFGAIIKVECVRRFS